MTKARDLASGGFGLVLVKPSSVVGGTDNGKGTVSFSAQSAISLNTVFSSIYENYKVLINLTAATADTDVILRLRNGATDKSTNYVRAVYGRQSTSGGVVSASGTASGLLVESLDITATYSSYSGDILNPFNTAKTISVFNTLYLGGDAQNYHLNNHTIQTENYSADGISLLTTAGNITGTISVYGYNK